MFKVLFFFFISHHCEATNIYRPSPLSPLQISDSTMGCKQQSNGNRFHRIYMQSVHLIRQVIFWMSVTALLVIVGKQLCAQGSKCLWIQRFGRGGGGELTTALQPITSMLTQHKDLVLLCVYRIKTDQQHTRELIYINPIQIQASITLHT